MPATSTQMVGKGKTQRQRELSPRKSPEVQTASELSPRKTKALGDREEETTSLSPRRGVQGAESHSAHSPSKNTTDHNQKQEAYLVYGYLAQAGQPVEDLVIAMEVELAVPLVRRALQNLRSAQLVTLIDEKENTWAILRTSHSGEFDSPPVSSPIVSCLEALVHSPSHPEGSAESLPSNTLTSTPMPKRSIVPTSPTCQSGATSAPTTPKGESLTLSPVGSPAPEPVQPENGQGYNTPNQLYGEKESASLSNVVPASSLLSNLTGWSDADFEQFLEDSAWQVTVSRLQQFEPLTWEPDTGGNESLSFPTLTSGDRPSPTVRPPGSTKCEQWFRTQGLIPPGSQLGTRAIASLMGFPSDWFEALQTSVPSNFTNIPNPPAPQDGLEPGISPDEAAPQPKLPLFCEESSTWMPSPGDRVKLNHPHQPYQKGETGTVTLVSSLSSIHVQMERDGAILKVANTELNFEGCGQQSHSAPCTPRLGDKQLSLLPLCPECDQELTSYQSGCGACGWQGTPVMVNDYTNPQQKGIVLKDLGDKFEVVLENGAVGVYAKLYVYPDFLGDEPSRSYPLEKSGGDKRPSSYPLEKADATLRRRTAQRNAHQGKRKPASGTLYSYIAHRKNKKGIIKEYQYWAYSYEVKDPETGKWKSKKKSVPKWMKLRVKDAIAQRRPVAYVLEILAGKR